MKGHVALCTLASIWLYVDVKSNVLMCSPRSPVNLCIKMTSKKYLLYSRSTICYFHPFPFLTCNVTFSVKWKNFQFSFVKFSSIMISWKAVTITRVIVKPCSKNSGLTLQTLVQTVWTLWFHQKPGFPESLVWFQHLLVIARCCLVSGSSGDSPVLSGFRVFRW